MWLDYLDALRAMNEWMISDRTSHTIIMECLTPVFCSGSHAWYRGIGWCSPELGCPRDYAALLRNEHASCCMQGVAALAAPISFTPPTAMSSRRFHSRCGDYIRFSENSTVASRVASYNNGIAFTEQPVPLDSVFQVKILEYEDKWIESIVSVRTNAERFFDSTSHQYRV